MNIAAEAIEEDEKRILRQIPDVRKIVRGTFTELDYSPNCIWSFTNSSFVLIQIRTEKYGIRVSSGSDAFIARCLRLKDGNKEGAVKLVI